MTVCKEENVIKLWKLSDLSTSIHTFVGHKDLIIASDFRIRNVDGEARNQLVSLSRDNELCIWQIPAALNEMVC